MIKIFKPFIILLLLLITADCVQAQNISEWEKKYFSSKKNLEKGNYVLDSLKLLLNEKANQINYEKNKKDADKDKIVELMSSSVVISNKFEAQQTKVNQLEKKINSIEKELDKRYSSIIDSLQLLQSSDAFNGDKDKLNLDVLLYMEKKLAVAPKISLLSFDPAELLKIDHNKTKDALENTIYREYLQNAYDEVKSQLENVNQQYSEINHIMLLQKKMDKFLKETEFENGIRTENSSSNRITYESPHDGGGVNPGTAVQDAAMMEQYRGSTLLLNQLNIDLSSGNKLNWQIESMNGNSSLSLKQYKKALEDLKKKLQEYKLVLGNKIGTNK